VTLTAQRIPLCLHINILSTQLSQRVDEGLQHKDNLRQISKDAFESMPNYEQLHTDSGATE
jgi:hypothetical protein